MMETDISFVIPNVCTIQMIRAFLDTMAPIFQMKEKRIGHVKLVVRDIKRMDIVGVLLIYKVVEFSARMDCFDSPKLLTDHKFVAELQKRGFYELIASFVDGLPPKFESLKYQFYDNVFIAPIKLNAISESEAESDYIPRIQAFYEDKETCSVVLTVLAEIVSNFHEHAQDKTDSILVARGDADKFEVVCADTGIGVISTMASSLLFKDKRPMQKFDVLEIATEKGVTSKQDSDHMGFGLWLIQEYVLKSKGDMQLYSEGAYYVNQCGKIKKGTCGFWQGTIIYVSLPLNNIGELQMWQAEQAALYEDIKINCV